MSSSLKYGFLERPSAGRIAVTERARQAIRPQKAGDDIEAFRQAVLEAPDISEVYTHYRGEYLPDDGFFEHALEDKFSIPAEKVPEFKEIFLASLQSAQLVEKKDDKYRILDSAAAGEESATTIKKLSSEAKVSASDSCFVVMPFASPVRGDIDEVVKLLERIGAIGQPNAEDYRTWPVFRGIRSDPRFKAAFKKVFGVPVVSPEPVEPPLPGTTASQAPGEQSAQVTKH